MDWKILSSQWDRLVAIVLTVAGAIGLIVGFIQVQDSTVLAEQTRYIVSGGIGGLFMLGLGATLWISADLRDEWRKLDRIERALGDGVLRWAPPERSEASARSAPVEQVGEAAAGPDLAAGREHA